MSVISFCSLYHGQAKTTTNMLSSALYMSFKYKNIKSLILNAQHIMSNMENVVNIDSSKFNDMGIDSLLTLAKNNSLSEDEVSNYSNIIISNKLEMIGGTKIKSRKEFKILVESINEVLKCCEKSYDYTFVDCGSIGGNIKTNSGYLVKKILDASDVIVINLSQNANVLKEFQNNEELKKMISDKKTLITIGDYQECKKYNINYISKLLKEDVYPIVNNPELIYYCNEKLLVQYIEQLDKNNPYYECIMKISKKIIKISCIEENKKLKEVTHIAKKSILNRIFA